LRGVVALLQTLLVLAAFAGVVTLIFLARVKRLATYGISFLPLKTNVTAPPGGFGVGSSGSALWTFPTVLVAAIMIAWGAEVGQFIVSQGMSLAILAWLQVLPEFTVEAAITHSAAVDPANLGLITANFTGANRLLVGVGWPLIFFVSFYFYRREARRSKKDCDRVGAYHVQLSEDHSVEVMALLVSTVLFLFIYFKGTLTWMDSTLLIGIYVGYLAILSRLPPESETEQDHVRGVPKMVLRRPRKVQIIFVFTMFLLGGSILFLVAEPFLQSLEAIAIVVAGAGAEYFFIQWVAPFLSEFPEKVSAFYWARTVRFSPMAVMNMVSSTINQWTVLIAMIPIVYCISLMQIATIHFSDFQRWEIILTVAQSMYAVTILLKMRITVVDACTLLVFWFIQFATPTLTFDVNGYELTMHEVMTVVYLVCGLLQLVYHWKELTFERDFRATWRKHIARTLETAPEEMGHAGDDVHGHE
jgi:cation:H+ antiporter